MLQPFASAVKCFVAYICSQLCLLDFDVSSCQFCCKSPTIHSMISNNVVEEDKRRE